ncbi:MAG TPA: amino acid adenylation domain-containing protein [Thermoanaerobaculia bacterium]|nr:amino acid adenylation domain-containing protein [Thermoanaerobaculia bacterium]
MNIRDFCGAIEATAARTPGKIAVEDSSGTITYADLIARARALDLDVPPHTAVGIQLPPSIDYVATFLGIAMRNAVPMPIDVQVPPLRLAQILEKSGCTVVLTTFSPRTGRGEGEGETPSLTPDADDPAYILFTSGSTGTPKAILGRHRGLSHFLRWELAECNLDETTRTSWLAPTTFDVSLRDMLIPLCAGGTLCIPSDETRTNPRLLLRWLHDSAITLTHIVPTVFRLLLTELETSEIRPRTIRHVLLAGEPLYGHDVNRWRAVMGNSAQLVNLYGPSETTLAKAFHRIPDGPLEPAKVVPIGHPLPNTAFLILEDNRLCDIGEIGEIYVKTPYRSLGYLNDPELTAAAFVDNPLHPGQNDLVYRTGDLGRYLPDRVIECLGRLDHQVKISGIRIEPAEIEHAVRRIEGIRETVVVAHKTANGTHALACYYTVGGEGSLRHSEGSLRSALATSLPSSMIPTFFIELASMPTTVSGKINRRALPRPEELLYEKREYRAPSTGLESRLATIWGDVLGLKKVSVDHPFVELGGDSLKGIRVVSAIYKELGVELGLKDLFASATIAALAPRIAEAKRTRIEEIPALPPAPDYPVSHAQHRLWTLDRMEIDSVAYNLPLAFHLRGAIDADKLRSAFARLVARHESLRTTFVTRGDSLRQRVAPPPATFTLPLIDLASHEDPDRAAEEILERDRSTGFGLEHGPLLRARLLRLGSAEHVLAVCLHHIICDVWSLNVLERELQVLYDDPAAPLEPLHIHYRDFAAWQNERLASGALDGDRAYWRDKLGGELPVLELPTDSPRPAVQTFRGTTHRHRITGDALARLASTLDASPFVVLQALVKTLLHRWTAQRDLIVGSPVLGRQHPDLESQVGLYVNTLALRDDVDPELPFADLVARVKQTTHDAFAHQAFPFDVLIDELQLARDMSHSPLFDVMLVVQEEDRQHFAPPYGRENAWEFSRFDLVFHFTREGEDLVLDLNYNTDLFRAERAQAMAAQFETLLRNATPSALVGDLDILPVEERARIERFSTAEDRQPHGLTIVSRFEEQVARTPDAIALVHGSTELTYAQLDALANDVARGYRHGELVVVTLRRSIEAMTTLLGVLKAGAIYIPVDPDLPESRINAILADAAPLAVRGERVAEGRVSPTDVAYMIYTSGSTGTPKGVLVEHEGFVNMSLCQNETFGVVATDRVAQFASASFDASLAEIFSAWFAGAALVLVDRATIDHPADFLRFMDEQRITVITLPPVYLAALHRAPMPSLRVLITAGEAARTADLLHYAKTKHVFNAYGPTETSVCATMYDVRSAGVPPADAAAPAPPLPIGRPVDGTSVFVLDERMHLAPLGVAGEICVAGRGLARGYHRNEAATAEKFVTRDGVRLYKTGDRGRWRTDGNLEFLGRLDHQVKVHGHRVELGAIEQALRQCEGVGDAFVTTLDGDLAAYVTPAKRLELWPSVAEFFVYDDVLYRSMATDEERNRRYREVFAEKLKGAKVVEVGPGAECVLSRLALDAGAAHVYAIEILRETYERAKQTLERLGLTNRITLIHGDAMQVELPERVDWCISEIVGGIGGSEGAAAILNSVRRFLKRGENMIPQRSVTCIAAVEANDVAPSFSEIAGHYVRRIFEDAGEPFDLRVCLKNAGPQHLLSDAGVLEDLDFTRDTPLEAEHRTTLTIERDGTMSGFLVWLNLHVDDARVVDILRDQASWIPVYVPMPPRAVKAGEVLDVTITRTVHGIHPDFAIRGQDIDVALPHRAPHFRATPFYDRLFANGIPITPEPDLREQLRSRLASHEMPSYIVRLDKLPLNRSGKVDRKALPDPRVVQREIREEAMSDLESRIAKAWREILGRPIALDDDFFASGGDSIKAIRIASLLHQQNIRLELRDIFQHPTVRACAAAATTAVANIDQAPLSGEIPATPIQRWFFDHYKHAPQHFNQSVVLRPRMPLDRERLRAALETVVRHHDALRMRVKHGRVVISEDASTPVDEWTCDEADWHELADDVQASFDFNGGPLLRALLVHLPDGDALWLLCHHLVVDVVSWNILIEDLEAAYRGLRLPLKTHSIAAFANALRAADFEREREYWSGIQNAWPVVKQKDRPAVSVLDVDLEADETRELLSAGRGHEIVLTALGIALRKWCGAERTVVDVESHGRTLPGVDVSRTVGWFTTFYPVVLEAGKRPVDPPNHGLGYGVLTQLGDLPQVHAEIGFNYLGELSSAPRNDGLFAIEWDAPGAAISPEAERVHAIEILAVVLDGRLRITLSMAGRRESAVALAEALRSSLAELRGTPASFTFAGLSEAQLDELVSEL